MKHAGFDVRVWCCILGTALVPAAVAVIELGRVHPDEIYQSLEPAYARAFGYGVLSWEWQVGLRNWALPGLFSALLRSSAALGLTHPQAYRAVLELPQFALHAASLAAVYLYARRRVARGLALASVVGVGWYAPVITFGGRTLSESFSTSFLMIACALLDAGSGPTASSPPVGPRLPWRSLAAGAGLGLAVVARYPSAVFVAVVLGWLWATRQPRTLAGVVLGGGLVLVLLALLDWATWGRPLHSLLEYVDFNLLSGKSAKSYGRKPILYYVGRVALWAPLWLWPGLVWASARQPPRLPLPALLALFYLVAISLTPHKEPRFAYPALVLLALAAAPAAFGRLALLASRSHRQLGGVLLVTLSLGPYFIRTELDAERGDEFRAIVRATRTDATGLLIANEGPWGAGGYFYIGKNIPWLASEKANDAAFRAALDNPLFNRAVTYDDFALPELERAGFRVAERVGRASIATRASTATSAATRASTAEPP